MVSSVPTQRSCPSTSVVELNLTSSVDPVANPPKSWDSIWSLHCHDWSARHARETGEQTCPTKWTRYPRC